MEGGELDMVVVERRRPAESTDCGAAGGEPIRSRCGMRVWLWLLQIDSHINKGTRGSMLTWGGSWVPKIVKFCFFRVCL